jgi:hypothetical protein
MSWLKKLITPGKYQPVPTGTDIFKPIAVPGQPSPSPIFTPTPAFPPSSSTPKTTTPSTPTTPPKTGGGGGGSSGGGGVTIQPSTPTTQPITTPTISPAQQQAQTRQQIIYQATMAAQDQIVLRPQGIQIGSSTYTGGAMVPGTGMTAQQFRQQVQQQAIYEGQLKKEEARRAEFTLRRPETTTTTKLPAERKMPSPSEVYISPELLKDVSFWGVKEGKQVKQKVASYESLISTWGTDAEGRKVAPSEQAYYDASKLYQDIRVAEARYDARGQEKVASWIKRQTEDVLFASISPVGLGSGIVSETKRQEVTSTLKQIPTLGLVSGVAESYVTYPVYHPIKTIALVGVGAVAGPTIGALTKAVPVIPGIKTIAGFSTPAISTVGATKVAGVGLLGYYGYTKYSELKLAPSYYEKGGVIGRTGAELTALGIGAYVGPKVSGYIRTLGRKEIAVEKLVPKDVLSGKNPYASEPGKMYFQRGSAKAQLKLFQTQSQRIPGYNNQFMYHATGDKFWGKTFVAAPGTSEFPGLYGSYGISPKFLRISGGYRFFGFGGNYPSGKAGVLAIQPKGFIIGKTAYGGRAFIPGVKAEVEAILAPGTTGTIIDKGFFTTWKGIRFPIDIAKVTSVSTTGAVNIPGVSGTSVSTSSSSFGASTSYPIYTPESLALSTLVPSSSYRSYTPSKITYTPTSLSSTTTSYPRISTSIFSSSPSSSRRSTPSYPSITPPYPSPSPPSPSPSPPSYPSIIPSSYSIVPPRYSPPKSPPQKFGLKLPGMKLPKMTGKFPVLGRRFGEFKPVGVGRTKKEAFSLGTEWASKTLGATFKIPGTKAKNITGFKTKKTKEGDILYIEEPKLRLRRKTEVKEIQLYRGLKRRKKKK